MLFQFASRVSLAETAEEWHSQGTATIFESRTLQSSPESSAWVGYDGSKRRKALSVGLPQLEQKSVVAEN